MLKEYDREKGIEAIIALQKHAGINEPRKRAEKNWDKFSNSDKESTMWVYKIFIEKITPEEYHSLRSLNGSGENVDIPDTERLFRALDRVYSPTE